MPPGAARLRLFDRRELRESACARPPLVGTRCATRPWAAPSSPTATFSGHPAREINAGGQPGAGGATATASCRRIRSAGSATCDGVGALPLRNRRQHIWRAQTAFAARSRTLSQRRAIRASAVGWQAWPRPANQAAGRRLRQRRWLQAASDDAPWARPTPGVSPAPCASPHVPRQAAAARRAQLPDTRAGRRARRNP